MGRALFRRHSTLPSAYLSCGADETPRKERKKNMETLLAAARKISTHKTPMARMKALAALDAKIAKARLSNADRLTVALAMHDAFKAR